MLWPKKNSYKEFDKEKKFLRIENSLPPTTSKTFLMVRPLTWWTSQWKAPLVVYHLQKVPGNAVAVKVEHDFSGLSSWEFPRATERLER